MNEGTYVSRVPHPEFREGVRSIVAWHERTPGTIARREVAQDVVTLILNLGPPLRVGGRGEPLSPRASFVAPMNGHFGLTEFGGESTGIQIDVSPTFARRLLGVRMSELDAVVYPLDELTGSWGADLVERLGDAAGWEARLDLLEAALRRRLRDAEDTPPDTAYAWSMLRRSGGTIPVSDLTRSIGCSERHLSRRFRDHVGLGPKASGRVIRFHRTLEMLTGGAELAEAAAAGGYSDQPHMNRDFGELAGSSPGALMASRMADVPGFAHFD